MKYLLFAGDDYYPSGGTKDLIGAFETIEDAKEEHKKYDFDYDGGWANILCLTSLKEVWWFSRGTWERSQ